MNLDAIPAGKNPPSDINVVIEINHETTLHLHCNFILHH